LTTDKRSDEMITAVRFPLGIKGTGYAFDEMNRRMGDFAVVSLAAVVTGSSIRLGVGGVASTPTVRDWAGLDDDQLDDALNAFAWDLGGSDDIHATGRYRRELVRRIGRRTIKEARLCRS
jgi:2-furoyl-CoA dehydrogenase FAD binding subunit